MAKFAIECPHCGTVNKASTFPFAKKTLVCGNCKSEISVKDNRMAVGRCENCGEVSFDIAKGKCPICHQKIGKSASLKTMTLDELKESGKSTPVFTCPECQCNIQAINDGERIYCPVCNHSFNGYEEIYATVQRSKLVNDNSISVIKYEGDNETFVWKHPIEDFNMGSQLIVHESQEAVFFLNGQALDLFGPGRYTLETENLPILKKIYSLPTGGAKPFHSEVYFINKVVQMGLKWGTDERVRYTDPQTGLPLTVGACGEMSMTVSDARKLLVKLVGSKSGIAWGSDEKNFAKSLASTFRPMISATVKSNLAKIMQNGNIAILNVTSEMDSISAALAEKIAPIFEEYGLAVPKFFVTGISVPEDDPNYKRIYELQGKATISTMEIQTAETIEKAKAAARANIIAAERAGIMEAKATELAVANADIDVTKARTEADMIRESAKIEMERRRGLAEAEVMAGKGYTQKDVLQADVQKAYAEGIGKMGENGGGAGAGGGVPGVIGLGVSLAAMGAVSEKVGESLKTINAPATTDNRSVHTPQEDSWLCSCGKTNVGKFCPECGNRKPEEWTCPECGKKVTGKFCPECGTPKPEEWTCPECGKKTIGKFCPNCGTPKNAPKPQKESWDCPECGNKGITGKFCPECGSPKPAPKPQKESWDCPECGNKGITGKFCPECGSPKPAPKPQKESWDCPKCGNKDITGKFCPECGERKVETAQ